MYAGLLTSARIRASTRGSVSLLQEAESDRARVIYSAAFRRLQGKTQVFPLDENAAVRTRLTHSLEVANVGRYLAASVIEEFRLRGKCEAVGLVGDVLLAFPAITEAACLLHDLGNPPFGHYGENVIARWFEDGARSESKEFDDALRESDAYQDFLKFDGNPQGFRIAARIAGDDRSGLNLTCSLLASMIKYSRTPAELARSGDKGKAGVFESESDVLEKLRTEFSLKPGQRFPIAYLMEAADDISYALSDLEDGIEKGIIDHEAAVNGIRDQIEATSSARKLVTDAAEMAERYTGSVDRAVSFRSFLVRQLVAHASQEYVSSHDAILAGTRKELIDPGSDHGTVLRAIKAFAKKRIYDHSIPQGIELSGHAVLTGLLERYGEILRLHRSDMVLVRQGGKVARHLQCPLRLYNRIGPRQRNAYEVVADGGIDEIYEWCARAHLIVDYISGMTDEFALSEYQRTSGIRL